MARNLSETLNYIEEHKISGEEKDLEISKLQSQVEERDVIIAFLKKELQKKTYCRQVMKRQYRELKQKYDALLEKQQPKDKRFYTFFREIKNGRT